MTCLIYWQVDLDEGVDIMGILSQPFAIHSSGLTAFKTKTYLHSL